MAGKVAAVSLAVAGHPIAAVAQQNAAAALAVAAGAVAGAGWAIVVVDGAAAEKSVAVLAAEVPVMGCAFAFVCRFALRRLVDC